MKEGGSRADVGSARRQCAGAEGAAGLDWAREAGKASTTSASGGAPPGRHITHCRACAAPSVGVMAPSWEATRTRLPPVLHTMDSVSGWKSGVAMATPIDNRNDTSIQRTMARVSRRDWRDNMDKILLTEDAVDVKPAKGQKKATLGWLCKSSSVRGTSLETSRTRQHHPRRSAMWFRFFLYDCDSSGVKYSGPGMV